MTLAEIAHLIAGAAFTALLLALGHWFPLPNEVGKIKSYAVGVSCLLLGFTLTRLLSGGEIEIIEIWVIAVVGGLTVVGCYWIDDLVIRLKQAEKARATDDELGE